MSLSDIIGQAEVIERLRQFGDFFASRAGTPGHILLIGEDGMGKRTIANAFANELEVDFQQVDASRLTIVGDLTAMLTNIRGGQVLLVEHIELLKRNLCSLLQSTMRDNSLSIILGAGPSAREHVIQVKPFTLIATCPSRSECPSALLSLFSLQLTLEPYSKAQLEEIVENIAKLTLEPKAAKLLAEHCDGRPSDLESTLHRLVRAVNRPVIGEDDTLQAFSAFGLSVQRTAALTPNINLDDLSGEAFEKLIANLLARMGFKTQLTSTTGDGGIDIIATLDTPIFGGRYLFQCKRFAQSNLVGAPLVRDFYGAVTADHALKGIFVTTSDFTPQAREFGEKVGLELINLSRLRTLFVEYGLADRTS